MKRLRKWIKNIINKLRQYKNFDFKEWETDFSEDV